MLWSFFFLSISIQIKKLNKAIVNTDTTENSWKNCQTTVAYLEFSPRESRISSPSFLHTTSKVLSRLLSYSAWHLNCAVVPLMICTS